MTREAKNKYFTHFRFQCFSLAKQNLTPKSKANLNICTEKKSFENVKTLKANWWFRTFDECIVWHPNFNNSRMLLRGCIKLVRTAILPATLPVCRKYASTVTLLFAFRKTPILQPVHSVT